VKDAIDALHRPSNGLAIPHVTGETLELQVSYVIEPRGLACEQAELIAAVRERAGEVSADQAGGTGDERLRHRSDSSLAAVSTALVSDTTSYLPNELIRRHDIHEVSLYVSLEGQQQRESEITDYGEFYGRLAASGESVTTSQPSIGDFTEVYEPLLAGGDEIVSIHISSQISGTCEAAEQAKQRLIEESKGGERIHVVDSRSGCGGMAVVLLGAAEVIGRGADAAAAVVAAEEVRATLKIWFAVDTLEYLRRGGRIGAASALIGTTLKIKPILTLLEEITPLERVRTSSRAYARLLDHARESKAEFAGRWVVQHVQSPDEAARLADDCREVMGTEPAFVSEVGPVIGAHVGPGLLGFGGSAVPS
jgi:fatty acid kinase fatty acid binding subunit